jgi:hypothetical protein
MIGTMDSGASSQPKSSLNHTKEYTRHQTGLSMQIKALADNNKPVWCTVYSNQSHCQILPSSRLRTCGGDTADEPTTSSLHVRLFQECLFLLRVPSGLTRKGPSSFMAPNPRDEHPGPAHTRRSNRPWNGRWDNSCLLSYLRWAMSGLEVAL